MKQKAYLKPAMEVVEIEASDIVCGSDSNSVTKTDGNAGLEIGGGGNGQTEETSAHGKRRGIWEDE